MKKVFFLVAVVALSVFCACEKETVEENPVVELNQVEELDQDENLTEVEGKWFRQRCYYFFERGFRSGGNCFPLNGICSLRRICFPIYWDPCWFVPCWIDIYDPWDIFEKIDPRDFLSFRDKLELDIDPRETAIPFALNEKVAGLQFYKEAELFKDNIYTVKDPLILDAETSRGLGLQGNVVKPGEYPVIFNKENGTHNIILAVEKGFEK